MTHAAALRYAADIVEQSLPLKESDEEVDRDGDGPDGSGSGHHGSDLLHPAWR
jgi:hypothetical protein